MPILNYEPGINFKLPDAPLFRAIHGACPRCGDYFIVNKHDSFYTDAGHGQTWLVNNTCGLCPACYKTMKRNATDTKPAQRFELAYTTSILNEDGTYHVSECYQKAEL